MSQCERSRSASARVYCHLSDRVVRLRPSSTDRLLLVLSVIYHAAILHGGVTIQVELSRFLRARCERARDLISDLRAH